ncbi:MAG TPA: L-histidine N(alpha)-methyltransferase [Ktedonobacteraceae bacterium]|nr:L-histidine N(alpha)-methyltransferase [Ktedonobacteraceae bacterium]
MLYFKNTDLATTHHISLRTVLNWIEATKQGKLDLTLYTRGDKSYVANTSRNIALIEQLVNDRKKYRNKRSVKVVTPKKEFYELYDEQQVLDIVSNLDVYHEIPRQYNYFDQGAHYWDEYTHRLIQETSPNLLTQTVELLNLNQDYIDYLIDDYDRVNIVDVGAGNALPVKQFLEHMLSLGKLGRYIALDISPEMLQIARQNVQEWFGDKISFEGYELDITHDRFNRLLADEYIEREDGKTINIVLIFGGTLGNLRSPDGAFKVIHDSMGRNDIMIFDDKLDTASSRRYFDFSAKPTSASLAPNHRFIFDLFQIDESLYEVEMGYDPDATQRYIRVRLKVALVVSLKLNGGTRVVNFNKGDTIQLWRSWQQETPDITEQFERNEFHTLLTSETEDQEYLLAVTRIRSSNGSL